MPAPRLLDKKLIHAELATQKKEQIQAGISLAKKVDAVRDTLGEEEERLDTFRRETTARIQLDIDIKIRERDELERGNASLREERMRLLAPIDLTQAWNEVEIGKIEITEWRKKLTTQSVQQMARENTLSESETLLRKKLDMADLCEDLATRNLKEAEEKFEEASTVLDSSKEEASKLIESAEAKLSVAQEREADADERDRSLSRREKTYSASDAELSTRESALKKRGAALTIEMQERESNVLEASRANKKTAEELVKKESLVDERLSEANSKLREASTILAAAEEERASILSGAVEKEKEVQKREASVSSRESTLLGREEVLYEHEANIASRELELESGLTLITQKTEELVNRELDLISREKDLQKRSEEIARKDEAAETNLLDAEEKNVQIALTLKQTQEEAERVFKESIQRESHLSVREEEATIREAFLSKRERENERHENDLGRREIKLRSRQELFQKAQDYIKRKTK